MANYPKKSEIKEKSRYSDEELKEFRQIILAKLEKAHDDLKLLEESCTIENEHGTNDTSPRKKEDLLHKSDNVFFVYRQKKFIKALENALIRIDNKSYGICRCTGKLISKDRLRLVPHATLGIEAKRQQITPPPLPLPPSSRESGIVRASVLLPLPCRF